MPVQPPNVDFPAGLAQWADVGTPQVGNLVWPTYQTGCVSVRVTTGRAKSAFNSEQVPVTRKGVEAPQERWSRGCRRAHVSFWFWLRLQLWLLAPRRPIRHRSRLCRSPSKPVSTSNYQERACRQSPGRPAPTHVTDCVVVTPPPKQFECVVRSSYSAWADFFVSEVKSCPNLQLQYLVRWPFWPPVQRSLIQSRPNPFTTSSADWRPSASATASCATRIISRRCVPCPVVRTAASKASNRPSPLPGNGRSACPGQMTAATTRTRRTRSVRGPSTDPSGPLTIWAAALLSSIGPCDCTDRSMDRC